MVEMRPLGGTGLQVSSIGHGLWGMGSWTGSDDEASFRCLTHSVKRGCNFFDSAMTYGDGRSDRLLGRLLAVSSPGDIVAASKIPPANGHFPGGSIKGKFQDLFPMPYVLDAVHRLLDVIGVDSLDLLQLHVWDDRWAAIREFHEVVGTLKERGLVRNFGVSLNRWEPNNGVAAVQSGLVDTVQVVYNIFCQAPEDRLFPACVEYGVGVIARVPLDEGSLAGGLTHASTFPDGDWRGGYFNPRNLRLTVDRVERLRDFLTEEMALDELALRFALSHEAVSTVLVGMRRPEHIDRNVAISELGSLPAETIRGLRQHRWDRTALP